MMQIVCFLSLLILCCYAYTDHSACSFQREYTLKQGLRLRQNVNYNEKTMTIALIYPGKAWLGYVYGSDLKDTKAIIGVPDDEKHNLPIDAKFYHLGERGFTDALQLEHRAAEDATFLMKKIVQTDEFTLLTIMMPIEEGDFTKDFIYAIGSNNQLHKSDYTYGYGYLEFSKCDEMQIKLHKGIVATAAEKSMAEAQEESQNDMDVSASSRKLASCSFGPTYSLSGRGMLREYVDTVDQTVTMEVTYNGLGWIGVGFSPNGGMLGVTAVIGLPNSGSQPAKYYLGAYSVYGTQRLSNSHQSLTDSSIMQNSTHTVLKFTKPLVESGESMVSETGTNTIIWGFGYSDGLAQHRFYGQLNRITLTPCNTNNPNPAPTNTQTTINQPTISSPPGPSVNQNPGTIQGPGGQQSTEGSTRGSDGDGYTSGSGTGSTLTGTNMNNNQDCTLLSGSYQALSSNVFMRQHVDLANEAVTIEITYAGQAWIGFGFSDNGRMVGTTSIIGIPNQPNDSNNPGKYNLNGKSVSQTQLLSSDHQTLTNASITQNNTHTVLRFTKPLVESGETTVSATGPNIAIFAVGYTNSLGNHPIRGAFQFQLSSCGSSSSLGSSSGITSLLGHKPNKELWMLHSFCMAIAWGVLVPVAIGFSLLRHFFEMAKTGSWFQLHFWINWLAVLLTVIGFAISIVAVNNETAVGEPANHFKTIPHRKFGLIIMFLVLLQVINGLFRPPALKKMQNTTYDKEEEASNPKTAQQQSHLLRKVWEVGHRIFGVGLLAFTLYNCYLGIDLYEGRYGRSGISQALFWGIVAGVSAVILVLYVVQRINRYLDGYN